MKRALILVDIQNDFVPGGALAVPRGNEVVTVANRLQARFDLVLATQDWHPPDHASFAANHDGKSPGDVIDLDGIEQILWPVHCVEETDGARFLDALDQSRIERVFRKGTDPRIDSYSGFFDNGHRRSTGLDAFLAENGVEEVFILGLATDYCVRATALDAVDLGLSTFLVKDGCRGVDLKPGDVERAIEDLKERGVTMVQSAELIA